MTKKMNMKYLNKKEEEQTIIKILDTLLDPSLPYSGKHRKEQWEKGWKENLDDGSITPRYFGKYPIHRLNGRFIKTNKDWEIDQLHHLVWELTKKYFNEVEHIYEFGCGTGHNLLVVDEYTMVANPGVILHGLDWATSSQKILKNLGLDAHNFDFFKPSKLKLEKKSGVYTVAALEQTGTNYKKFVSYLLKNKPSVVVHIEPIPELLDPTKLLDYLSIRYMEKRKYLSGYFTYLQSLEAKGKIKILEAKRSGIGSMFIDGYSVVVWKPV